jgi:ferrous iron transport protein A
MDAGTVQTRTLDQLAKGQTARVVGLTSTGLNRRRMMDLGILPGTQITIELVSPMGDPTAYQVRGAVVALRKSQAREIQITLDADHSHGEE